MESVPLPGTTHIQGLWEEKVDQFVRSETTIQTFREMLGRLAGVHCSQNWSHLVLDRGNHPFHLLLLLHHHEDDHYIHAEENGYGNLRCRQPMRKESVRLRN